MLQNNITSVITIEWQLITTVIFYSVISITSEL